VQGFSTSGVGVEGRTLSASGAGVIARGSGASGTALQIQSGAIKVLGAGVGTNTTVFIHVVTLANSGVGYTRIDHPLTNGDPNAILIVTPNHSPGGVNLSYDFREVAVRYDATANKWMILTPTGGAFGTGVLGAAFNVLILKP
jgi:hypothetical protein